MSKENEGRSATTPSSPPNNFHLDGNDARLLLRVLLHQGTTIRGNEILQAGNLVRRLNEINVVQPPTEKK